MMGGLTEDSIILLFWCRNKFDSMLSWTLRELNRISYIECTRRVDSTCIIMHCFNVFNINVCHAGMYAYIVIVIACFT